MDVLGLRQVHPKPCQILAVKNAELPSSDPLYGTYVYVFVSTFFYFLMKGEQRCCRVFLKLSSDKSCSTVPWQSVLTNTLTSSNPRCIELRAIPFPLATSAVAHRWAVGAYSLFQMCCYISVCIRCKVRGWYQILKSWKGKRLRGWQERPQQEEMTLFVLLVPSRKSHNQQWI